MAGELNVHQTAFEFDHYALTIRLFKADGAFGSWRRKPLIAESRFPRSSTDYILCMSKDKMTDGRHQSRLCSDYMSEVENKSLYFQEKAMMQLAPLRWAENNPAVLVFLPHNMFPVNKLSSLQKSATFHNLLRHCGYVMDNNMDFIDANLLCSSFLAPLLLSLMAGLSAIEFFGQYEGLHRLKHVHAAVGVGHGLYAAMVFTGAISLRKVIEVIKIHADALERGLTEYEVAQNVKAALDIISVRKPRIPVVTENGEQLEDGGSLRESMPFVLSSSINIQELYRNLYQNGMYHVVNMY